MAASELQRLVEVMDRLRSPGGCPWDAEQTHESLIKYLLEESYEFIDSVDAKDRQGMREELGDVLLQVYFHARMAQDHPTNPFSIEDMMKDNELTNKQLLYLQIHYSILCLKIRVE